tara:strand:- start:1158 stop:2309 length:1152 start_codon:yes stop_codon:yes gene_type:complete
MTVKVKNVIKQETGGRTYYIGYLYAKDIYDCVFVPVLKKTKLPKKKNSVLALEEIDKGYQRTATVSRQRKIAEFLSENPDSIIPPVLLSDRGLWKFNGNGQVGELEISDKAAVVDGQHRLGGMRFLNDLDDNSNNNLMIPFVCVANLEKKEEEMQFLTINNEQKGLQKQHTAVLRIDQWHNACAMSLNENGPFRERIQTGGPKEKWQLDWKLNSVASMINQVFKTKSGDDDPWGFSSDDERKDNIPNLLIKYWEIVVDVFDEEYSDIDKIPSPYGEEYGGEGNTKTFEYKLLEFTGFLVFMRILKLYATTFWNRSEHLLNEDVIYKYLNIIKTERDSSSSTEGYDVPIIDLRKIGKYQYNTGLAGAPVIVKDVQNLVSSKREI